MNWKSIWNTFSTNPYVVGAWTAFAGALATELYSALQTGSFDWSVQSWKKMLVAAALTAATSVYHLLTPSQGQQKEVANLQSSQK